MKHHVANMTHVRTAIVLRAILAAILVALIGGCNIFGPFHTPGDSDNVEDLLSDAHQALDEEEYDRALQYMDKAMTIAPDDQRVRYLHAVAVVKVHDIDLIDVIELFQPAADGSLPADADNQRLLFLSGAELVNLFDAFKVVRVDLAPLARRIVDTGHELQKIQESDDVLMSYGIAETLLGMLRVLDNDDTANEFTVDDRVIIEKSDGEYIIRVDDSQLDFAQRDQLIDDAVNRAWHHFVAGREAFFLYYQFTVKERIWTDPIPAPPALYPESVDDGSAVGDMAAFVDVGVRALYLEKEDL